MIVWFHAIIVSYAQGKVDAGSRENLRQIKGLSHY